MIRFVLILLAMAFPLVVSAQLVSRTELRNTNSLIRAQTIPYLNGLGIDVTISNSLSLTGALAGFRVKYDNSSSTKTNFSITHNGNETFMVLSTSNTWAWLDNLNGINLMSHVANSGVMSLYGGLMNFSGGNVGIGTNAPLSPLHLVGGNFVIGPAGEIEFQDVATGGTRRRVIALENQHLWLGNETNLATTALLAHDTIDPESFAGTLTFYGHAFSPSVPGIRLGHGVPFGSLRLRNRIGDTFPALEITPTNGTGQPILIASTNVNGRVGINTNNPQSALHVHGDLTVNGGLSVTTFHTDALNILSNRLAVADAANHQFDLSLPWKELEYTNSMTQGTRIAITNAASTNFSTLRVEVEGAASGGSNFAITNTFPSGDLAQLNGAALAVSITDTVTNGMKIEDSWQKTWKRGTNIWVGYRTYNAR